MWGKGFCTIGEVTWASAAYVARYVTKKVLGDIQHYCRIDTTTGEILEERIPEYATMSRGGRDGKGLAYEWWKKYKEDCHNKDFITVNGIKMTIPKYYDRQLDEEDPQRLEAIKTERLKRIAQHKEDNTEERLKDREIVKLAQFKKLQGSFEG